MARSDHGTTDEPTPDAPQTDHGGNAVMHYDDDPLELTSATHGVGTRSYYREGAR